VSGDVFEEDPGWLDFADDAGNIGPQVPLVVGSLALPGMAEWLAGIPGEDGVDCPSERSSVERGNVVPYRSRGEVSGALGGDEDAAGILLPFDEAAGVESWLGEHEAHIQASAACAEGQSVSGTYSHVTAPPR
jgi:hypothetical protein